jgi:hypothetical protein
MTKKKSTKPTAVNHPANTRNPAAHLERYKWKPGVSPNPAGRPKKETPSETLSKMLGAAYGPDVIKQLQKTMPEPWRSKAEITVQEILTWVILRRAMQNAGDNARKECSTGLRDGRH